MTSTNGPSSNTRSKNPDIKVDYTEIDKFYQRKSEEVDLLSASSESDSSTIATWEEIYNYEEIEFLEGLDEKDYAGTSYPRFEQAGNASSFQDSSFNSERWDEIFGVEQA